MSNHIVFKGDCEFRQVLILSLLSGKSVVIEDIRTEEDEIGLAEYHVSLLQLIDELTSGTKTKINETGTRVVFYPGFIIGGDVEHECDVSRPVGYYMEVLVCLAAFSKHKFSLVLHGVTHGSDHPNADTLKHVTMSYCKRLGLHSAEVSIKKRGYPPLGGGQIHFTSNIIKTVKPLQWLEQGKIKRIRGVASCSRMSPTTNPRVIDTTRGILNAFIPDVYIYNEHLKGAQSGKSPGSSLMLYTESTSDVVLCSERLSGVQSLPEDLATLTTHELLDVIHSGGCVDPRHQYLVLLYMALTQNNVSQVRLGPLTPYTVSFIRNLKLFFGVVFKIKVERLEEGRRGINSTVLLSCLGAGFQNMNRSMT